MLHACFRLLEDYVRWHGGPEKLDEFGRQLQAEPSPGLSPRVGLKECEAVLLYRWWTVERPADYRRLNELVLSWKDGGAVRLREEIMGLQGRITDDEQAMLRRLIEIRPGLMDVVNSDGPIHHLSNRRENKPACQVKAGRPRR